MLRDASRSVNLITRQSTIRTTRVLNLKPTMATSSRTVLITGGSSGIGRAIAQKFAQNGDTVTAWGRDPAKLKALDGSVDGRLSARAVDVTRPADIIQAISHLLKTRPTIDVLVNAAGCTGTISTKTPLIEATDTWNNLIATNLTGSFLTTQSVAPHLAAPGGRVIMIGSQSAFNGSARPGGIGYAAAKSGLNGLTFALAKELAPTGITVNQVVPGFVAHTGITESWTKDMIDSFIQQTPAGRAGTPQDIDETVFWLASSEASFVNAQIIQVNGGLLPGR